MLNLYDFELSVLLNFGIGGKVMDQGYQWLMHAGQYGYNFHRDILDRWTPENSQTKVPAVDGDSYANRRSTRFLSDASFLNVKNVLLGYQVPDALVSRLKISLMRLKLTADNLALVTSRKGLDPQFSLDGTYGKEYIPVRTFSVGIDVQL